ncbi:MAG: pirin family protein [Mycobacteriales bacterium]
MTLDVRRARDRLATRIDWLDSRHSFSFGQHYDPANTHFGLLLVSNDDVVAPGSGFSTHPHRDMEIVTWVLDGELAHQDSHGHSGLITPGLAQRMSAGTGMLHSEINAAGDAPVRFVQMWVLPDTESVTPSYDQLDITAELDRGGLVPVASGRRDRQGHDAAISIRQAGAVLWAARLQRGESVQLPDAPYVHLFVARGEVVLEGAGALAQGDAVRMTAAGGPALTATSAAEVLVWEMQHSL